MWLPKTIQSLWMPIGRWAKPSMHSPNTGGLEQVHPFTIHMHNLMSAFLYKIMEGIWSVIENHPSVWGIHGRHWPWAWTYSLQSHAEHLAQSQIEHNRRYSYLPTSKVTQKIRSEDWKPRADMCGDSFQNLKGAASWHLSFAKHLYS